MTTSSSTSSLFRVLIVVAIFSLYHGASVPVIHFYDYFDIASNETTKQPPQQSYTVPWLGTGDLGDPASVTDLPEHSFATVASTNMIEAKPYDPIGDTIMPFTCSERMYGYYADPRHNCTVFHVCFPYESADGGAGLAHYAFECPKPTIFDQQSFVCNYPDEAYSCQDAERLYGLNEKLTTKLKDIVNHVLDVSADEDFS